MVRWKDTFLGENKLKLLGSLFVTHSLLQTAWWVEMASDLFKARKTSGGGELGEALAWGTKSPKSSPCLECRPHCIHPETTGRKPLDERREGTGLWGDHGASLDSAKKGGFQEVFLDTLLFVTNWVPTASSEEFYNLGEKRTLLNLQETLRPIKENTDLT